MRTPFALAAAVAAAALASTGCATTVVGMPEGATNITTSPAGARVFINGAEVCSTTPCTWNEGDGLAHRYHLQLRKEGYQEVDVYLDKELRFFSGSFSIAGYRMPRQMAFTLAPGPGGPPPAGEPPGQKPPL
ncbi:MAG TPA: PEGA domain-containing protein [Myxococcales bacterium]|nr:PEGA domain-containing protein [Myxococcales bacterium]